MARKNKGAALVSAAIYGFASGIGRQAARDVYSSATDPKLQPDESKATVPINEESGEVVFEYIKKDSQGCLKYCWYQELPLVWYDKRWKKFREGCFPDGRKTVVAECSTDKQETDRIMSEKGIKIVVRSSTVRDTEYKEAQEQETIPWLWWLWIIVPGVLLLAVKLLILFAS